MTGFKIANFNNMKIWFCDLTATDTWNCNVLIKKVSKLINRIELLSMLTFKSVKFDALVSLREYSKVSVTVYKKKDHHQF